MAKKRLDVAAITNELQHSAFFPAAVPRAPQGARPSTQEDLPFPDEAASTAPAPATPTPLPTQQSGVQHPPTSDLPITDQSPAAALRPTQRIERADSTANGPTTSPEERQLARDHASSFARTDASMLAREHAPQATPTADPAQADAPQPPLPHAPRPARGSGVRDDRDVIEAIRKCVRQIGKTITYVRLTPDEKRQLTEIAFTYKGQGLKTSENEISRIGIKWMLEDYRLHGHESVLARVLAALNA